MPLARAIHANMSRKHRPTGNSKGEYTGILLASRWCGAFNLHVQLGSSLNRGLFFPWELLI
jgi:hypothetical protein